MAAILNFIRVVRANGGVASSFMALWKRDDLKAGNFVGEDEVGNKYYENDKYFLGKNRWVHYADHFNWNYDPSQVRLPFIKHVLPNKIIWEINDLQPGSGVILYFKNMGKRLY